ncbi:MAG TPA: hypothetical protein VEZ42_13845 [Pseudonocardia sp.]|nr:hypothetical protein [Pseudonocardia sp.]
MISRIRIGAAGGGPYAVTVDDDGTAWVTPVHSGQLARVAADGAVELHELGAGSRPSQPADDPSERSRPVAVALHRVTRVYGVLAVVVPVVGIVLAVVQGRMGEVWIDVAMVLTVLAGVLLALGITPLQRDALAEPDDGRQLRRLGMLAGIYNLLWAVVVLMIVRPGGVS